MTARLGWVARMAEQIAGGRELVVLADGPWAHRWYWAEDLTGMQHAVRRYPPTAVAGVLQNYQATTHRVPHPDDPDLTGTAYRYHQPPPAEGQS